MKMKKCAKGHFFDESLYSECPYCKKQQNAAVDPPANAPSPTPPAARQDDNRTRRLIVTEKGIDPVVGWLVCIDGPDKGRDYRIKSDMNYVGRSREQDICIQGDDTISRERHGKLSYNGETNSFKIYPGEGRGLVILNGQEVTEATELHAYDTIRMGKTKLMFVPFCEERFVWGRE